MNRNNMVILTESDISYIKLKDKTLDELSVFDFKIPRQVIYEATVIIFESEITDFRKVLKNRFGKQD